MSLHARGEATGGHRPIRVNRDRSSCDSDDAFAHEHPVALGEPEEEPMTDATTEFFGDLAARGHVPALEKATGTVRFDVSNGKRTARWLVTVKKGDVTVSKGDGPADSVVRAERAVFERIARGEVNGMAAILRGAMNVEGDPELLVLFQRLFPGPPGATGRPPAAHSTRSAT
jgi:predicted lipid carrier protein YhbT